MGIIADRGEAPNTLQSLLCFVTDRWKLWPMCPPAPRVEYGRLQATSRFYGITIVTSVTRSQLGVELHPQKTRSMRMVGLLAAS